MKFSLIFMVFILVIISGCTINTPRDLKVSNVVRVGGDDLKQLMGTSIHQSWIDGDFLVVRLSTTVDLVKYTEQKSFPLGLDGMFCDELKTPIFIFGLYGENESYQTRLISLQISKLMSLSTEDKKYFNYYALIPVSFSKELEIYGRPERGDAVFYSKYNLDKSPRDICFVVGGSIFWYGFESNAAVLKKESIKNYKVKNVN
jgi:hypothetical protein